MKHLTFKENKITHLTHTVFRSFAQMQQNDNIPEYPPQEPVRTLNLILKYRIIKILFYINASLPPFVLLEQILYAYR